MNEPKYHPRWSPSERQLWIATKEAILLRPQTYIQSATLNVIGECLTAACLGGWAHFLSGCRQSATDSHAMLQCAGTRLGLTAKERYVVFSALPFEWPRDLRDRFFQAAVNSTVEEMTGNRTLVAAEYIDHILATGLVE